MRVLIFILLLFPICLLAQTDSISGIIKSHINHSGKQKVHSILFYLNKEEEDFTFHEGFGLTKKNGDIYYGHYGSSLGYCPQKKITIIYNISQQNSNFCVTRLVNEVLNISSISNP